MADWPFDDAKNTAVFTLKTIVAGHAWIAQVWHDADDGAWQFLSSTRSAPSEAEGAIVGLETITRLDASVLELADLPLGWYAHRASKDAPWQRRPADA